jgi:hypothetical protein
MVIRLSILASGHEFAYGFNGRSGWDLNVSGNICPLNSLTCQIFQLWVLQYEGGARRRAPKKGWALHVASHRHIVPGGARSKYQGYRVNAYRVLLSLNLLAACPPWTNFPTPGCCQRGGRQAFWCSPVSYSNVWGPCPRNVKNKVFKHQLGLQATSETINPQLQNLSQCQPLEATWVSLQCGGAA